MRPWSTQRSIFLAQEKGGKFFHGNIAAFVFSRPISKVTHSGEGGEVNGTVYGLPALSEYRLRQKLEILFDAMQALIGGKISLETR